MKSTVALSILARSLASLSSSSMSLDAGNKVMSDSYRKGASPGTFQQQAVESLLKLQGRFTRIERAGLLLAVLAVLKSTAGLLQPVRGPLLRTLLESVPRGSVHRMARIAILRMKLTLAQSMALTIRHFSFILGAQFVLYVEHLLIRYVLNRFMSPRPDLETGVHDELGHLDLTHPCEGVSLSGISLQDSKKSHCTICLESEPHRHDEVDPIETFCPRCKVPGHRSCMLRWLAHYHGARSGLGPREALLHLMATASTPSSDCERPSIVELSGPVCPVCRGNIQLEINAKSGASAQGPSLGASLSRSVSLEPWKFHSGRALASLGLTVTNMFAFGRFAAAVCSFV